MAYMTKIVTFYFPVSENVIIFAVAFPRRKPRRAKRAGVTFMEWSVCLRSSLTNCKTSHNLQKNGQKMWQWVNAHGRCILYPATNCCIGAIVDYGILCGFVQGSIYHYVGFLHCPSRLLRASEKACSSWDGQGESHVSVLWRSIGILTKTYDTGILSL